MIRKRTGHLLRTTKCMAVRNSSRLRQPSLVTSDNCQICLSSCREGIVTALLCQRVHISLYLNGQSRLFKELLSLSARNDAVGVGLHCPELGHVVVQLLLGDDPDVLRFIILKQKQIMTRVLMPTSTQGYHFR